MALFPDAKFKILVPSPGIVPGTRLDGSLEVFVPEDIPRAQHVDLFFRTHAQATYNYSENAWTAAKDLFVQSFRLALDTSRPLPRGSYSYPFSFDVPAWLPPAFNDEYWQIQHFFDVRLDVDWALDPTKSFSPRVVFQPVDVRGEPVLVRSPRRFHESLVVELKLDKSPQVAGEPVTGEIALRGGHELVLDSMGIMVSSMATMVMAHRDRRRGVGSGVRVPGDALRRGESVPFSVPWPRIPHTFRTGYIDHDVVLNVKAILPWSPGPDPSFDWTLHVVPHGSSVQGPSDPLALVGTSRLARLGAIMAEATGWTRGRSPCLVEGKQGPIRVRITDGPRAGALGVDIEFGLPDLDLGIELRPLGTLDRLRDSPLLPRVLAARKAYLLRVGTHTPEHGPLAIPVPEPALKAFFDAVLEDMEPSNEVRLTDHHFGLHLVIPKDNDKEMVTCAKWAKRRAEALANAIARLPFAALLPEAEPAWRAAADEQQGYLLPHVPALHGVILGTRTLGGDFREMHVRLRTRKDRTIAAVLDLTRVPIPAASLGLLEGGDVEMLRPVRAVFPRWQAHSAEKVTLEGAAFAADPRPLLSVLDVFLTWLLDVRGERRTQHAYR